MITEISQKRILLPRTSFRSRSNEEIIASYRTKLLTEMLTKLCIEGSRYYRRMACWTEYRMISPEACDIPTNKQMDIQLKLLTGMAIEKTTKNAPKFSSKWLSLCSGPLRPYRMPNQDMPKSANAMHKVAFLVQKRACYMVSMTYWDVNMLEMDQSYTTHAWCNCCQFCHPQVVTVSAICKPQLWCQEREPT